MLFKKNQSQFEKRRKEFEKKISEVYKILQDGSNKAHTFASEKMKEVKNAMRINYFDDKELINNHIEKYAKKDQENL